MRSEVQSSPFKVIFLSLALLVGQQIFDETTNGTAVHVQHDQCPETQLDPTPEELTLYFGARPFKTHETTAQIFRES